MAAAKDDRYTALVVGATGACGKEVVVSLAASEKCKRIVALTRRDVLPDDYSSTFPGLTNADKITMRTVHFENLQQSDFRAPGETPSSPPDALFYCLGTTRKDAGSAEAFRTIDLGYLEATLEQIKDVRPSYFGLISSQGANKNSWFLYPKTKGQCEEAVKEAKFERASIFRPGLLDRGGVARTVEKVASWILPSTGTNVVGAAMVKDFEQGSGAYKVIENSAIKNGMY